MPAIKGKMEKKSQTTQESSEEESSDESPLESKIDPQTQPLPADPSDDEMTGSVDRPPQTKSIPTDTQRYRDEVDSEDDIQITHILPRKTSKPTGSSQPISIMTSDGKVLEGQLTPAYLVQRTMGVSQTTTAPTGFQTIQGVRRVRPEVGVSTQTEKSPVEGSVHVYPGKIIDKKVVTTKAEVYAVPTTSQARPTTQAETGLLGEAALATGPTQITEKSETAMVTYTFSSISVSDRETPMGVDSKSLMTQYVELSSGPDMTEGTEQEDEGMETTIEIVGPALQVAMGSREHPENSQAAMEQGVQVLEVDLVTPAERDELMRNLTGIQQLDASGAIDPALQCRAGQELLRQSREVAARPLQGGNTSLDGARSDSSDSELVDPVDAPNMQGLEDGEVPPSPKQEGEHMDVSADDGKNSERDENSQSEQENWQQNSGLDEKGHDPSQSRLGWSEGEEVGSATEARQLSRQEKEERRKEHERDFPPITLFISHRPDPDDDPSCWYQGEDCLNPNTIIAVSKRMALPTPDGALSGNGKEPLPSLSGPSKYRG